VIRTDEQETALSGRYFAVLPTNSIGYPVRTALSLTITLLGATLAIPLPAQNTPGLLNNPGQFICNYTGNGLKPQVVCNEKATSNGHAEKVVDRILRPIGLLRNFKVVECANTDNCFATVLKGQRFIVYDAAFMQNIEEETETDWSAISIMAHEIGHHLQGHTIDGRGGQPQKELEADKFSGFVLHQLGASLQESLVAVQMLGNTYATPTHPAKPIRVESIRKGWLEAEAMYPKSHSTGKPAVATAPKPVAAPAASLPAPARTAPSLTRLGCVSGNCDDGKGVFVYPTQERYVGEFIDGDKHGTGAEYYPTGKLKYRGLFQDNLRMGYGLYYYHNGDRYEGQFARNVPNGKGVYTFSDGERITGSFRNGQPMR